MHLRRIRPRRRIRQKGIRNDTHLSCGGRLYRRDRQLPTLHKAAAQDLEKGQHSFNKCLPCHAVGPGAENKVGPELNGLDGRHAGTAANFNYSDGNKNSGIVWNEATFKDYIRSPQAKVPGTKMAFAGITNPQEIEDLWAYLKQFGTDGEVKK